MGLKELAEGIMLQSIEDLWDEDFRDESVAFFGGTDFKVCAEMSQMSLMEQVSLLRFVKGIVDHEDKKRAEKKTTRRHDTGMLRKMQKEVTAP